MAAVFKSTILSKFARSSSHTSKSYGSWLPDRKGKIYVDKNDLLKIVSDKGVVADDLLKIVLDKGVVADDAEKVASFIEKSVEPAIRKAKHQEIKYLIMHHSKHFVLAGACLVVLTIGSQTKNYLKEKDK